MSKIQAVSDSVRDCPNVVVMCGCFISARNLAPSLTMPCQLLLTLALRLTFHLILRFGVLPSTVLSTVLHLAPHHPSLFYLWLRLPPHSPFCLSHHPSLFRPWSQPSRSPPSPLHFVSATG